jgi:hypothetical protein
MSITSVDAITQIPLSMLGINWDNIDESKLETLSQLLESDEQYTKLEAQRQKAVDELKKSQSFSEQHNGAVSEYRSLSE